MLIIVDILHTSLSLAIIYGSYTITTEYLTFSYQEFGFISYILIFVLNVASSLLAPFIVFYLTGVKWTIVIGAISYLIWLLLFNLGNNTLLLIGAVFLGIGAGLFRSQQNVWITSLEYENSASKDYYVGIYNAIFGLNGVIGAIFTVIILYFDYGIDMLVWILLIISVAAFISLVFIKPVKINNSHEITLKLYYQTAKDIKLLLLLPLILYQSCGLVVSYELLPVYFAKFGKFSIALMFLLYSVVYCINMYILSVLIKKTDVIFMLLSLVMINGCLSVLILLMYQIDSFGKYFIVLGVFAGLADSIVNFIVVYLLHAHFESKIVYSIYRSSICVFSAITTALAPIVSIYCNMFVFNLVLYVGVLFYIIFKYKVDTDKILYEKNEDNMIDVV
jgi:MFS family permease